MLKITDNKISLTRGDTAYLTIPIKNTVTGKKYSVADGDTLEFTLRKAETDSTKLVHKTLTGEDCFHILPTDTSGLAFGRYVYDVQLTTADGDVYTVIPPTAFEVAKEVSY